MRADRSAGVVDRPDVRAVTGLVLLAETAALPGGTGTPDDLVVAVAAAVAGGVRRVIVRDKHRPVDERAALVAAVSDLGVTTLVAADELDDVAVAFPADGVHLSSRHERCQTPSVTRRERCQTPSVTRPRLLGVSCHDAAEIERAVNIGADYVTVSPVYPTASKPGYGPALGPDGLAALAAQCPVPVVALGGIATPAHVEACLAAGAVGVAVMGAVLRSSDPAAVAAALTAAARSEDA